MRHAHLAADRLGDLLVAGAEPLGEALDELAPLGRRGLRPGLEGGLGRGDGPVDVVGGALGDAAHHLLGGGVDDVDRAGAGRRHPLAVDVELVVVLHVVPPRARPIGRCDDRRRYRAVRVPDARRPAKMGAVERHPARTDGRVGAVRALARSPASAPRPCCSSSRCRSPSRRAGMAAHGDRHRPRVPASSAPRSPPPVALDLWAMVAADREGIRWRNRGARPPARAGTQVAGFAPRAHRHRAAADRRARGARSGRWASATSGRRSWPPSGSGSSRTCAARRPDLRDGPSVLPIRSLPCLKLPVSRASACWASAGLGVGEAVDRLVGGRAPRSIVTGRPS